MVYACLMGVGQWVGLSGLEGTHCIAVSVTLFSPPVPRQTSEGARRTLSAH